MAGMDVLLKQFGLTPDKIEEMARPVVTAILNKVAEFDANEERRHAEVMVRLDKIAEQFGSTEPAGEGESIQVGDDELAQMEANILNPRPLVDEDDEYEMEDTITLES